MVKNIGVDAAKLAGLQIDQNQKLRNGQMTIKQVEWWLNQTSEARERLVQGKSIISGQDRCWWRGENGVIYFSLPKTDGTTDPEWINRLEKKGIQISKSAKDVLNSLDFHPTTGVIYNIAVLPGSFFKDGDRTTKNIRAEADRRNFAKPNVEIAYLIREKFSDEDIKAMGFSWIVTMHEPVEDSGGDPTLLCTYRSDGGVSWLRVSYVDPDSRWYCGNGFAFVVSQIT